MAQDYNRVSLQVLEQVARLMCVAARTAPKTRGRDHLIIRILEQEGRDVVAPGMKELAEQCSLPAFARAAGMRVDNRVMYTLGRAAMEAGYLEDAVQAVGIPLSATAKNPFFDRE